MFRMKSAEGKGARFRTGALLGLGPTEESLRSVDPWILPFRSRRANTTEDYAAIGSASMKWNCQRMRNTRLTYGRRSVTAGALSTVRPRPPAKQGLGTRPN